MAILDPRLLPLLETLATAGADWLAFEVVEGIRRGREPEEPEDMLWAARQNVRSDQPVPRLSPELPAASKPILGDEQIAWAADYVAIRVEGVLSDLVEGTAMIEAIADRSSQTGDLDGLATIMAGQQTPLTFALVGHEDAAIDRHSIAAARDGLEELRKALGNWASDARGLSDA
jgi:hypothetical protein